MTQSGHIDLSTGSIVITSKPDPKPWVPPTPGTAEYTSRSARLYATYGITEADYEAMLAKQGGVCLICRIPHHADHPLIVDHNHETGKVRGLLCSNCNTGIGLLQDSAFLLQVAAVYLESEGSYAPAQFSAQDKIAATQ